MGMKVVDNNFVPVKPSLSLLAGQNRSANPMPTVATLAKTMSVATVPYIVISQPARG